MNPFVFLANIFFWLATRALAVYDSITGIPLLGTWLGGWFMDMSSRFFDIGLNLLDAAAWYQRVTDQLSTWLSSIDVINIMSSWISQVNTLWAWLSNWGVYVVAVIGAWWMGIQPQVLSWVDQAKSYAAGLVAGAMDAIGRLGAAWEDFRTTVLPGLAGKSEVAGMIGSALMPWGPVLTWWGHFGGQAVNLFSDPQQWFYDRLDSFFERFW